METVKELDKRIAKFAIYGQNLHYQIDALRILALDNDTVLPELARVQAAYAALPTQHGELTRRRVLAHIAELQAEAAALRPEYERLSAEYDVAQAEVAAWRQAENRNRRPDMIGEYMRQGHELSERTRPIFAAYEVAKLHLSRPYLVAQNLYGVGLDGSDFERHVTRTKEAYRKLPCTQAAYEAAAQQAGAKAAEHWRKLSG